MAYTEEQMREAAKKLVEQDKGSGENLNLRSARCCPNEYIGREC
jgi:hypothetical protein